MRSLYNHICLVECPCLIKDSKGNLIYERDKGSWVIPLPKDTVLVRGRIRLLGVTDNFFQVTPPPLPKGWDLKARLGEVSRIAQIEVNSKKKTGNITLDRRVFEDKSVIEGCKVFMLFHEIGHPIYLANESACDEFAFWHALRAGVTPFLCFLALAAYMPENYKYRVERLGNLILKNPQLKKYTDASRIK